MLRGSRQLGELPEDQLKDRRPGPMHDPGAGLIPEWYNYYTSNNYGFQVGTVSENILPANRLRAYVLVQNKDAAADMYISFGASADAFNGVLIIPRGNYELIGGEKGGAFVPSDSIHVLGTVANQQGVLVEGVMPPVMPY